MVTRLGLLLGSIAASAVLAVALAVTGFAPAPSTQPTSAPATIDQVQAVADTTPLDQPSPEPITQVDTVYVQPAPTPQTIRIVKAAPTKPPIIVHKVVRTTVAASAAPSHDGENDGESD